MTIEEIWRPIRGFSWYSVSSHGRVMNTTRERIMKISLTLQGAAKVSLWSDSGVRVTRSLARIVAEAFCKKPDGRCDTPVLLDADSTNCAVWNIVWRPRWFAWKYTYQFHHPIKRHYHNLPVLNVTKDLEYDSILDCAMTEGLLFDDVWRSTYSGEEIYPTFSIYQILK